MANPICTQQKHGAPIASQQRATGRTAYLAGATQQLPRHAARLDGRAKTALCGYENKVNRLTASRCWAQLSVATAKYPG